MIRLTFLLAALWSLAMSNYGKANRTAQWFANRYPGSRIDPNVLVVHTTEGTGWPGYGGGATAPTYTAAPAWFRKRLVFRAHFPDERSARALRNESGGVETNTLNAIQLELVGTCDPATHRRWGKTRHIYWPDAPEWALRDLAAFIVDLHKRHGIKLEAPTFLAYPASYGGSRVRFSFAQWRNFYGVCGHQHVPENSHGDPGALDMDRVLQLARQQLRPAKPPKPKGPRTRGKAVDKALRYTTAAIKYANGRREALLIRARDALRSMPTYPKKK